MLNKPAYSEIFPEDLIKLREQLMIAKRREQSSGGVGGRSFESNVTQILLNVIFNCERRMARKNVGSLFFIKQWVRTNTQWYDPEVLNPLVCANKTSWTPSEIWKLCLFEWQYENEAGWRWGRDYSEHLRALDESGTIAGIVAMASEVPPRYGGKCEFQVDLSFDRTYGNVGGGSGSDVDGVRIIGVADCVIQGAAAAEDENIVIELKFSRNESANTTAVMQAALYAEMLMQQREKAAAAAAKPPLLLQFPRVFVYNLQRGTITEIVDLYSGGRPLLHEHLDRVFANKKK